MRTAAPAVLILILSSGCRSTSEGGTFERHFSAPIWGAAVGEPFRHSPQRELLYGIGGLTLLAAPFDSQITSDGSEDHTLTAGATLPGDVLAIALGGAALASGAWTWGHSGDSRDFEIAAESLAATEATVTALKFATQRRRPGGGNSDSFPSGHTAFAFAGATLLARAIEDHSEDGENRLGYLFYLPALYVGIDRIEAGKHFVTDVGCGALIGIFLADWVHAAHMPDAERERPTIFEPHPGGVAFSIRPYADEQGEGIGLDWSF